jgi:hypothetical protein
MPGNERGTDDRASNKYDMGESSSTAASASGLLRRKSSEAPSIWTGKSKKVRRGKFDFIIVLCSLMSRIKTLLCRGWAVGH